MHSYVNICSHVSTYVHACCVCSVCVLRKGVKMGGEAGRPELEYRECGCCGGADKQGSLEEKGCQGGRAERLRKAIK